MKRCPYCGCATFDALRVIEEVALDHGVSVEVIKGPSRARAVVEARDCAVARLREHGLLLKEIGALLGGRDHSTIAHSLAKQRDAGGAAAGQGGAAGGG